MDRAAQSPENLDGARGPSRGSPHSIGTVDRLQIEAEELDDSSVAELISFFKTLDQWDREAKRC